MTSCSLIKAIIRPFFDHKNLQWTFTTANRNEILSFIKFIPLARPECDDSLPFSGASSIPLCYVLFPATLLHQLFFHPPLLHLSHLYLGLPVSLVVPKFIYNTLLGILFSSIFCTCPTQYI